MDEERRSAISDLDAALDDLSALLRGVCADKRYFLPDGETLDARTLRYIVACVKDMSAIFKRQEETPPAENGGVVFLAASEDGEGDFCAEYDRLGGDNMPVLPL